MPVSVWTKEHDAFLTENRSKMLGADLAKAINKKFGTSYSKGAVLGRAHRLNLPLDKAVYTKRLAEAGLKWTDEQDELLRTNYGKMYGKDIAALINETTGSKFTRFAVVARAQRLGLIVPGSRTIPFRQKKFVEPKVEASKVETESVSSHRKTILDLRAMECRWPDEDRDPETGWHTFCGCRTADASSYCPTHTELSKGQGTASERNALGLLRKEAA